jgi:hypothetical protein
MSKFPLNTWFGAFATLYFIQNTRVREKKKCFINVTKKHENKIPPLPPHQAFLLGE